MKISAGFEPIQNDGVHTVLKLLVSKAGIAVSLFNSFIALRWE